MPQLARSTLQMFLLHCSLEIQMRNDGAKRRILDRSRNLIEFVLRGDRYISGAVSPIPLRERCALNVVSHGLCRLTTSCGISLSRRGHRERLLVQGPEQHANWTLCQFRCQRESRSRKPIPRAGRGNLHPVDKIARIPIGLTLLLVHPTIANASNRGGSAKRCAQGDLRKS